MGATATYDVIVVGAGSAGCLLASRLSEDPHRRVLLLEAGPDHPTLEATPADIVDGWRVAGSHDWGFQSEPAADGRILDLPRGKLVGGSSAVNACFALRGAPADYDAWAAAGNVGWSFEDVLPAFRSIERDLDFGRDPWHGSSGPLPIRRYGGDELTPLHRMIIEGAVEAGHPRVDDHNRPGAVGSGRAPTNCLDGRRISASVAFLTGARARQNLEIRPGALVDRVRVRHGRADGVRVAGDLEPIAAGAVVLAAGTYGSPAILLRSGIGPADELIELGIGPIHDLPGVGGGLVDHPAVSIVFETGPDRLPAPLYQSVVTFRSPSADPDGSPDLQVFGAGPWEAQGSTTGSTAVVNAALLKPRSRGWLRLRSADPGDAPRIDLGYFRDDADLPKMIAAVRAATRICATDAFAHVRDPELAPMPAPEALDDDDAAGGWIRANAWTYHHAVGTCGMGTDPAEAAVVDGSGRVHGLHGLVVADASVMPDIPSANTNLPTMMLAQRIADLMTL